MGSVGIVLGFGQGGDDIIAGNIGNDTLTGGDGADTFIYGLVDDMGDVNLDLAKVIQDLISPGTSNTRKYTFGVHSKKRALTSAQLIEFAEKREELGGEKGEKKKQRTQKTTQKGQERLQKFKIHFNKTYLFFFYQ